VCGGTWHDGGCAYTHHGSAGGHHHRHLPIRIPRKPVPFVPCSPLQPQPACSRPPHPVPCPYAALSSRRLPVHIPQPLPPSPLPCRFDQLARWAIQTGAASFAEALQTFAASARLSPPYALADLSNLVAIARLLRHLEGPGGLGQEELYTWCCSPAAVEDRAVALVGGRLGGC
jgi:hypothetical protein